MAQEYGNVNNEFIRSFILLLKEIFMVEHLENIYNRIMKGALKAAEQFLKDEKKKSNNGNDRDKNITPNDDNPGTL